VVGRLGRWLWTGTGAPSAVKCGLFIGSQNIRLQMSSKRKLFKRSLFARAHSALGFYSRKS